MYKLALNAGHGFNTSGKRCLKSIDPNQTREWWLNARVCTKIEEKLSQYKNIEWTRLDDVTGVKDIPLAIRTDKANAYGADFYLSIHHNAGIHGGNGGGYCDYVYTYADEESIEWQKEIGAECLALTGLKGNRYKTHWQANFHELRESKMPSVLCECGFMDSVVDTPIILTDKFADQIATACVNVIVRRWNLEKKIVAPQPNVKAITKGDLVAINSGARYYGTTRPVPDWARAQKWYVTSVSGDRVVLGENEKHTDHLNSAIAVAYLEVVTSASALPQKLTIHEVALQVIDGKWGSGSARKKALEAAGYNYKDVQAEVNRILKEKK